MARPLVSLPPAVAALRADQWRAIADAMAGLGDVRFCRAILPHVSRTFALTIPHLPPPLELHVVVGYLLCRIADTIEDDPRWTGQGRQAAFDLLSDAFKGRKMHQAAAAIQAQAKARNDDSPTGVLLSRTTSVFKVLATFPPATIAAIGDCVTEMVSGMRRMPAATEQGTTVRLFRTVAELEDYCHYVAGVVGIMLTRLLADALGPGLDFATPARIEQGRRFGLGLQLTNILADQAPDARCGKLYLPERVDGGRVVPTIVGRALDHLDEALAYCLAIPRPQEGIRCFCLLPSFFAVRTLKAVVTRQGTGKAGRPKISRHEVRDIMSAVMSHAQDDSFLQDCFERERAAVTSDLG